MIVRNTPEFKRLVKPGCRLLGIDYGLRGRGLALSDPDWRIARALTVLRGRNLQSDVREITDITQHHQVGGWIVGLPLHISGQEGSAAAAVRRWVIAVTGRLQCSNLPVICFWDERMSTLAVTRVLEDLTPRRRAQIVDKVTAAYILQGALDALAQPPQ